MKVILFANTDWYLYNFRLRLAKVLDEAGHSLVLVSPRGPYVERILKEGYAWQEVELSRRGLNIFKEIRTMRQLKRLYSAEQPDLVHHFTIKCILYGSYAAHKAAIPRVVNAVTGLGYIFTSRNLFTELARPLVRVFYRRVLKSSRVIFQNEADMQYFLDNKLILAEQCALIPSSGVDTDLFLPAPNKQIENLIMLPARMLWNKGVKEFVEAAKLVKKSGVKARFALVGDVDEGNPSSIPIEQLQKWQKEGFVEWWGWRNDMVQVYQSASVVCLPSYGEGLSKTLIEAAACGRPLVTTDIPGCREVVENGVNGLLVQKGNGKELAAALIFLLSDVELMHKMGIESRRIAVRDFSVEKVVKETLNVYNN